MATRFPTDPAVIVDVEEGFVRAAVFHPTTLAYLQLLVDPYVQVLADSDDRAALEQWVTAAFPSEMEGEFSLELEIDEDDGALNGTDFRDFIIHFLFLVLIRDAVDSTRNPDTDEEDLDITILPWDVRRVLNSSSEYAQLFGVDTTTEKLPVSVVVNGASYTIEMSMEQALGLLLFSRVSGVDFQPSMFGVHLFYFDDPNTQERFIERSGAFYFPAYRVTIAGQDYQFKTTDFMQGFSTGTLWVTQTKSAQPGETLSPWSNVDHHKYWSHLRQLTAEDAEPVVLQF